MRAVEEVEFPSSDARWAAPADVEIDRPAAAVAAWRLESFGGELIVLRPGEALLEGRTRGARVHLGGRWKEGAERIDIASRGAEIALDIRGSPSPSAPGARPPHPV